MLSRVTALTGFLLLACLSQARAGQFVVIESTAAALSPGQVVDATAPLNLAAGSQVTLVAEDGKVVKLSGPFSGKPAEGTASDGDPAMVQALSRLFASNQQTASAWGTFRGHETAATFRGPDDSGAGPGEVWAINIRKSESVCIPADKQPSLWRADSGTELSLILLHLSTGSEATLDFAPGVDQEPWPAGVPILDGGEYALRDAGNAWERRLTLRIIPATEASDVKRAAWMSDAGCVRQARALLAQL